MAFYSKHKTICLFPLPTASVLSQYGSCFCIYPPHAAHRLAAAHGRATAVCLQTHCGTQDRCGGQDALPTTVSGAEGRRPTE